MHLQRHWYIATVLALAAGVAIQIAAQFAASTAATAVARGSDGDARIADILTSLGVLFAGTGIALWVASTIKRQALTHTLPLVLLALYASLFIFMV